MPKVATHQHSANPWDDYAAYYDWENAQTMGRRDLGYWRRVAAAAPGPVLELGCGTGRVLLPMWRTGARVTGVDASAAMLARAAVQARRLRGRRRPALVRGDLRALPFADRAFAVVCAPYGVLQSLVTNRDLDAALAEAVRVLQPGGRLAIDLVPDLPSWPVRQRHVPLRGRLRGAPIVLTESVRQDSRRGLTTFDEEFAVGRGRRQIRRRFSLTFRTIAMRAMLRRLAVAGCEVDAVCGSYRGGGWHPAAPVCLIEARI